MSINTAQPARTTDLLTGLGNYQTFTDAIEAQMAQAAEDSVIFSLAVVDLGYFKQFTDEHGRRQSTANPRRPSLRLYGRGRPGVPVRRRGIYYYFSRYGERAGLFKIGDGAPGIRSAA